MIVCLNTIKLGKECIYIEMPAGNIHLLIEVVKSI